MSLGLLFLHYDTNTGDIKGIYTRSRNAHIPLPNISITAEVRDKVMANMRKYRVFEGEVIERDGFKPEFSHESLVLQAKEDTTAALDSMVKVGKYSYKCDSTLQSNIILGHIALQSKNTKSVKLWCFSSDGEWVFKEHTAQELADIASAFNTLRENASLAYHEAVAKLDGDNK